MRRTDPPPTLQPRQSELDRILALQSPERTKIREAFRRRQAELDATEHRGYPPEVAREASRRFWEGLGWRVGPDGAPIERKEKLP